jgi:hypothetical protein
MTRETNPDVHTIRTEEDNDIPKLLEGFPDLVVENELGFTKGTAIDNYPQVIETDSVDCYAKMKFISVEDGGPMMHYYIKVGISGFLFDPWGIFSEGTQAKDAKHLGKNAWEFRKVNKMCFQNYLMFLMRRNKAYFNLAEREVRSNA